MKPIGDGLFKNPTARRAAKDDATTQAAREIIAKDASDRIAKTERLRAARLAQEAARALEPPAPPKTRSRKTTTKRARSPATLAAS